MSRDIETVYIGRANVIQRVLQAAAVDLAAPERTAITRVQARFGDYCLDTDEATDPIAYDSTTGGVSMQIGLVTGIVVGKYDLILTCFDAATPEGFAWGNFRIDVKAWPICDV
jgi:hypothetical protein